jgi:hypothetical protein
MPELEYTATERAHDIEMLSRTYEIRRKLRSIPPYVAPVVVKAPVIKPKPFPRHRLDAEIYAFPLIYPEFVREELRGVINPNAPRKNTTKEIIAEVARIAGIRPDEITSQGRFMGFVRPRQFAMWRVSEEQKLSLPEIGRRFGGRDHTTALHAIRKVKSVIASGELDPNNPQAWFRWAYD